VQSWRGDQAAAFTSELWLWFFLGVVRQRWADRKRPRPPADDPAANPARLVRTSLEPTKVT
jgi:hypothetical protein